MRATLSFADLITIARFPVAVAIVAVAALGRSDARLALAALVLVAVASDLADGALARRTRTASTRGALLDSAADAAVTLAVAVALPLAVPVVVDAWLWWALGSALAARAGAAASWAFRFGRLAIAHTWANKAAGAAGVAAVIAALATGRLAGWPAAGACFVAVASGIDEAIMACRSREFQPDRAGSWRA